jgi:hypothetical protein
MVNPGRKRILTLCGLFLLFATFIIGSCTALPQNEHQSSTIVPPTLPGGPRSAIPTRPEGCVPLPYTNTYPNVTLTPTPDFSNPLEKLKPNFSPTVTPFPVTRTINLSPNTDPNDLTYTYVFLCNGDMDLYVSGPDVDIDKAIDLKYGDVVIASAPPASLMGKHPPPPPTPLPTPSFPGAGSSIPYPAPAIPGDTNLKKDRFCLRSALGKFILLLQ